MKNESSSHETSGEQGLSDLVVARRVLNLESLGLTTLADLLDGRFSEAIEVLNLISGRVVVSGMGKSGHVSRKIAATFSSTGTPAMFVHPGEASHGDLGMITREDGLLLISNSGETKELANILSYAQRFAIPVIAICGQSTSTLATTANVTLLLPNVTEACAIVDAPTTSTILSMALGDALAVALLERKGFTQDEYRIYHPGGVLGSRLVWVEDVMQVGDEILLVSPEATMAETISMMSNRVGHVGVVDHSGCLIASVTDGDIRRHLGPGFLDLKVHEVMNHTPKTIESKALASDALRKMNEWGITNLYVTDSDTIPIGMIRLHDCLEVGIF